MSNSPVAIVGGEAGANGAGFAKNLIINGDFTINQRGGTKTPGVGVYGYDRWKGHADGLEQVVEYIGQADTVTLSWVGGGTGTVNGTTGTSPVTGSVSAATNFSCIVPSTSTKVQCEFGSIATTYGYQTEGEVLAECLRYRQERHGLILNLYASSDTTFRRQDIVFPVVMRATPTVTVTRTTSAGWNGLPTTSPFPEGVEVAGISGDSASGLYISDWTADAEL